MTIEQKRCPRCAIKRTANLGTWGTFCFNCRSRLDGRELRPLPPVSEDAPYAFSGAELLRLQHYRAAIQAGLYSDWSEAARPLPRIATRD
jgi:hypothetical protein